MDALGPILAGGYLIGMLVSGTVIRARAGTGVWLRLKVFGPEGFGPVWIATATACSVAWPVTLVVWLARGRPEPRVVFNEKAVERQRRQAAAAAAPPGPARPVAPPAPRTGIPARITGGTGSAPPPVSPVVRTGSPAVSSLPRKATGPAGATVRPTTSHGYTSPTGPDVVGWEHTNALRAQDAAAAERARSKAREVLGQVSESTAGSLQGGIVRDCLSHGLTDDAADELLYWFARVRTTGAAADSGRRADCRNLLDGALDFLECPGSAAHPWTPEIRRSAVLLRSAVADVLVAGVGERAAGVLDAAPYPVAVPLARTAPDPRAAAAAPPWPGSAPVTRTAPPPSPGPDGGETEVGSVPATLPVPAHPMTWSPTRHDDPDRVLAAVLGGVVAAGAPVLDAVRAWVPDDPATAEGPPAIAEGAFGRVRRGAGMLVGSSGPGSPSWTAAGPHQRAEWWSERMGAVVAAAVAAASTSGPVAERASLRPAVSMAGQAFVLCAVAGEFGLTGRDEQVALLSDVLFGRTPPSASTDPDAGMLADVARQLDGAGAARITALAAIAWRLGSSLLTLRTELLDRPEPARRSRIGKIPGLGAVGGFLDERLALREVTASGVAWLENRSTPPGPPFGDLVSRTS